MENYTNPQKELIGALVGLARSLDETNSDIAALDSLVGGLKAVGAASDGDIKAVRLAKRRAVPDCSTCQNPCGKTFDYDLDELEKLDPETAELKYRLIEKMRNYAQNIGYDESDYKSVLDALTEGLFAVGYDFFTKEQLLAIIERISL